MFVAQPPAIDDGKELRFAGPCGHTRCEGSGVSISANTLRVPSFNICGIPLHLFPGLYEKLGKGLVIPATLPVHVCAGSAVLILGAQIMFIHCQTLYSLLTYSSFLDGSAWQDMLCMTLSLTAAQHVRLSASHKECSMLTQQMWETLQVQTLSRDFTRAREQG